MKPLNLLPPENLTIRLPGEAMERLRIIQNARKESGAAWKLEELAATLFAHFLVENDPEEIAWGTKPARGKKFFVPVEPNGAGTDA